MKLNSLDGLAAMPKGHQLASLVPRASLEFVRQRNDGERIVTGGNEWTWTTLEQAGPVVMNIGHFAVQWLTRPLDARTESVGDALVSKTDAENRRAFPFEHRSQETESHSCFTR